MANQPEVRYINHYVSGSLAYLPEKKTRRKEKVQLPEAKKHQKLVLRIDPVAIGGILVAAVLLITMICSMVGWGQVQKEVTAMKEYVNTLQQENAQLQHTYTSGYDPEEIREVALNMGMVPVEQVPHIQMQVQVPQVEEQPTGWSAIWAFILGMFA